MAVLKYTIDDPIDSPQQCTIDVTLRLAAGDRWLFFITPAQLAAVGFFVEGTQARLHVGERHMIVVSEVTPEIIDQVLRSLEATGELEYRSVPLC